MGCRADVPQNFDPFPQHYFSKKLTVQRKNCENEYQVIHENNREDGK
jgi:hypothetical protein